MRRYLGVFLAALGVALAFVLSLNLLLGDRGLGNLQSTRAASQWQQATRGVTYAPPVGNAAPFKKLRLADRLPQINAVVLGASTLMGVRQQVLPATWRIYNLTVTGNATAGIAGEARYIATHWPQQIKWVLAGLDWSVGNLYAPGTVGEGDLSSGSVDRAYTENVIPLRKRVEDALSWPRVANLAAMLGAAVKNPNIINALQQTFFDIGGAQYACADGAHSTVARDFDVINRGLCRGYRDDGSWTFANDARLSPAQAATLSAAAAAPSSKYTQHLCARNGEPNAAYLQHFGETAQRFTAQGGAMIFILPALMPGMENALLQVPRWKTCLEHTKSVLDAWARQFQVRIIDAGASERYGCLSHEFTDEHHAYAECYQRVLQRFFRDVDAGRVVPGLYRPVGP